MKKLLCIVYGKLENNNVFIILNERLLLLGNFKHLCGKTHDIWEICMFTFFNNVKHVLPKCQFGVVCQIM